MLDTVSVYNHSHIVTSLKAGFSLQQGAQIGVCFTSAQVVSKDVLYIANTNMQHVFPTIWTYFFCA